MEIKTVTVCNRYKNPQYLVSKLTEDDVLFVVPDPLNKYNENSLLITNAIGDPMGFIPLKLAIKLKGKITKSIKCDKHNVEVGNWEDRIKVLYVCFTVGNV